MNWILLQNSLLVSALATFLAVGGGFLAALWFATQDARGRAAGWLVALSALMVPPFLATNCWLDLLGYTGVWHKWLPLDIYSLGGTIWILALLHWPITFLMVAAAWNRVQVSQLECDPALTGWRLLNDLLWPVVSPVVALAAVVTFVLTLNHFAVPAILQTKVYPAELWVQFNTTFDNAGAARLSWPLVLAPLLLLLWSYRRGVAWPGLDGPPPAALLRQQLGSTWRRIGGAAGLVLAGFSVALPLSNLAMRSRTWLEFPAAFAAGHTAVFWTLAYATVTATVCTVLPFVGWRWRIGGLLWLPLLWPGVLLGIGLIFVMNRPAFGLFYQSAGIVLLAFSLRYLAVGWNVVTHALRTVDRDLTDDARLNGASGWELLRHVNWPQVAPRAAAAWYLTYLLCLWDVETLILIVPPGGETLALRVFNLLHYGHNAQVNALCLLLLLLATLPWLAWQLLRFAARVLIPAAKTRPAAALALGALALWPLAGCAPPPGEMRIESKIFSRVRVIGARGTGLGQFNKPRSVAVDAQDNLYAVDITGRVQKFSPDGVFISFWQMPQTDKGKPKGMCLDEKENIVVVEPHYSRVNHFTPEGKLVTQWGVDGTNAGQLAFPRSVAINRQGDTYVSEYGRAERVNRFSAQGAKFLGEIGKPGNGPGEFNRAEGIGLDTQGRLYVADSCNHRVQVFTPEGKFIRAYGHAGSAPGEFSYPYDVRVDKQGRQYVCEFGNSRVQVFDKDDHLIEVLGEAGAAPNQMNNPWAIALDSHGNLYVADALNHRVLKFIASHPLAEVTPAPSPAKL
ncbi:MAG TPA: 6-bladed beta-propeller [Verrucomicrobiae bacterium]|nr:6-bladed beta-propeller [Verrucomicrobiae bacterium]